MTNWKPIESGPKQPLIEDRPVRYIKEGVKAFPNWPHDFLGPKVLLKKGDYIAIGQWISRKARGHFKDWARWSMEDATHWAFIPE